ADREMADLRVAHLARGEADGLAGRLQRRVRVLGREVVEDGSVRELDGVSRPGRRNAPAVQDDDRYEREAAVRQIAVTTGPDGDLWFTENSGNRVGRITPAGAVTEFPIPTASSQPFGITAGPDGNLWFTEFPGGSLGRVH